MGGAISRKLANFVNLVDEMREAQKSFFKSRTGEKLDVARAYERKVDRMLREIQKDLEEGSTQMELF